MERKQVSVISTYARRCEAVHWTGGCDCGVQLLNWFVFNSATVEVYFFVVEYVVR